MELVARNESKGLARSALKESAREERGKLQLALMAMVNASPDTEIGSMRLKVTLLTPWFHIKPKVVTRMLAIYARVKNMIELYRHDNCSIVKQAYVRDCIRKCLDTASKRHFIDLEYDALKFNDLRIIILSVLNLSK